MKRAEYINTEYLEKHANEIINDTSVLSPQWLFFTIRFDDKYTWEEAEDRIVRDYCKATGHWDLFIWEEVEE